MSYGSSTRSWKPWRWVSIDLIFTMRDIYINSHLNPLTKFTSSSRTTEFKKYPPMDRALARKLKLLTFSRNWEIRVVFKSPRWLATRKLFWVLPVERWKMSSWEGTISEHNIIQHTQTPLRNVCFFVYHRLGWDTE